MMRFTTSFGEESSSPEKGAFPQMCDKELGDALSAHGVMNGAFCSICVHCNSDVLTTFLFWVFGFCVFCFFSSKHIVKVPAKISTKTGLEWTCAGFCSKSENKTLGM